MKRRRIILLEFKRTSGTSETYYLDMKTVVEKQQTPILKGLNVLTEERGWEVKVLILVVAQLVGQRSIREKQ